MLTFFPWNKKFCNMLLAYEDVLLRPSVNIYNLITDEHFSVHKESACIGIHSLRHSRDLYFLDTE